VFVDHSHQRLEVPAVGLDGQDWTVHLHQDLLGVAAQDELAHLGALPQPDNDQRRIHFPGTVEELVGMVMLSWPWCSWPSPPWASRARRRFVAPFGFGIIKEQTAAWRQRSPAGPR
jgi:hypothetical protein